MILLSKWLGAKYEFTRAAFIKISLNLDYIITLLNCNGFTYPLLNFLKGGRITALELMIQCLPTRTFARSPLMIASDWTMFFPLRTIFWDPQSTDWRLTRFPEAWKFHRNTYVSTKYVYLSHSYEENNTPASN